MVVITVFLIATMLYSIRKEMRSQNLRKTWANFALSIVFCVLFLGSWAAQGVAQWDEYRQDQREHHESVEVVQFVNVFAKSTLENWQSEFLQLFSFVVLSAVLIHRGSAESKDSDDRMEAKIDKILKQLETKS